MDGSVLCFRSPEAVNVLRLLWESFRRQRRRKALAGLAILLGTTAVTAMLALATTIGDRIHKELAVYGANIVVYPKAADLDVKVGGINIKPPPATPISTKATSQNSKDHLLGQQHHWRKPQSEWNSRITLKAMHPRNWLSTMQSSPPDNSLSFQSEPRLTVEQHFGSIMTGAPQLHPWWNLEGNWPIKRQPSTTHARRQE